MPRLLSIEHSRQEERTGCLAAWAQMALQHIGVNQTQRQLNRLLGTREAGVPASRVRSLSQFGVSVFYGTGDEPAVQSVLDQGLPPIVFAATGDLPYWSIKLRHAVLVVGYDEVEVYLDDPEFPGAPQRVSWGDFLLAWSEFDYTYALISPAG